MPSNLIVHEHPRMAAEALLQKRTRDFTRMMRQQLRFHAMDAGRLLQRFDDVSKQAFFNLVTVGTTGSIADKKIADNSLALLVNKKRVSEDASTLARGIAGKDLRIHATQDHLGGSRVVPGQDPSPHGNLIFQQRSKVGGREMSEIENFHSKCRISRLQSKRQRLRRIQSTADFSTLKL